MRRFKRVIQIEMNEVSYDIVQKCIARGELPHFAKILKDWEYVETVSENKYEHIEPWIQWVTAHTGKPYAEHGIFHLSDVSALRHDQIWESLSDRGIESAIVGCMNASRGRAKNGLFFPDPWAKEGLTYPSQLQPLWDFISGQVQSHAVRNNSIQDMIRGVQTSLDRKIPMRLFAKVAQQFVRQKLNPQKKWMLAALFDEYIYALFENILSETRFGFNAAFFNAIAHYQHHYWRQHDSSGFSEKVSCPDCDRYDDPIAFGLRSYDRILSRVMEKFNDDDTLILVATGLSQVPYLNSEAAGGMHYYRLLDHGTFVSLLRLDGIKVFPMMSRDWQISGEPDDLEKARQALSGLTVKNQPLFTIQVNSDKTLFIETAATDGSLARETIHAADGTDLGLFSDWFKSIAVKSGCHTGKGHLWASQPCINKKRIQLGSLRHIGVEALTGDPWHE